MISFVRCLCCAGLLFSGHTAFAQEWKSGVEWQEPPHVTPGETDDQAPSDAIVLFNGTDLSAWHGGDKWLIEDGVAIPKQGEIRTKQQFGDIQLHLEWSAPTEVKGSGQGRGNSGVFLMGLYEVQVLDSYDNETYFDGQAASIYKQTPPMANAMRPPGQWNTYDIFFTAEEFKSNGDLAKPAYITVVHNGVLVLNHFEILGPTGYTEAPHYRPHAETGPIALQFHGDPVRFRNIWVRELKPAVGKRVSAPFNIERPKPPKPEPAEAETGTTEKSDDKPDQADKPEVKDQPKPKTDKPAEPQDSDDATDDAAA